MRSFTLLLLPLLALAHDLELLDKDPDKLAIFGGVNNLPDQGKVMVRPPSRPAQAAKKGPERLARLARRDNDDGIRGGTMVGPGSGVVMVMAGPATGRGTAPVGEMGGGEWR